MNMYLMGQYTDLARALHANHGHRFAWFNNRWWMVTQIEGQWLWTQHWARERLVAALEELVSTLVPDNNTRYMLSTMAATNTGTKHVMAAAARLFSVPGLPAPAPEPAAPAPADPSTPEQLDQ